jgi:hypothetical protein
MNTLVDFFKDKNINEDDEYWKEEFFPEDKDDDDDDDDKKNECDECIETLDRSVIEQNTTTSAGSFGYMMPFGAKRPGVTDYMEKYDLLDDPEEKEKIKNLDKGPNPDRTYKKLDWDKLDKKHNENAIISLKLHNMF